MNLLHSAARPLPLMPVRGRLYAILFILDAAAQNQINSNLNSLSSLWTGWYIIGQGATAIETTAQFFLGKNPQFAGRTHNTGGTTLLFF